MNRNTANRYYGLLRKAILSKSIREARWEIGEYELDESYFGARRVRAGDERALIAQKQLRHVRNLVRRARPSCRAFGEHIFVKVATRTIELVERERNHDDARRDGVEPRAALASLDRLRHHALFVAALCHLVGVERVADVRGLQNFERKQLLRRRGRKQRVSLCAQLLHAVPALT